ncbi:MAG: 30S ribosomal protein S1 [Nitrospinae bacterium]|nr:30S ribosomal protein S1 [Nitrospinota bacterium]
MDEAELLSMAALYEESMQNFCEGELVLGRVVAISSNFVTIDIGFKSEGIIAVTEFPEGGKNIAVGDQTEVLIEQTENGDGEIMLSKEKAGMIRTWEKILAAHKNDEIIEGVVVNRIKGGLKVDIGLKAFLPGSQVDLRPVKNLDKLIGEKIKVKVINVNKSRGNIILSRRVILDAERKQSREETLSNIEVGNIVEGVVKNITDYGAFVDLGGVDGLLHITDMSWGRITHPSELFAIGDTIKVMIIKYDQENDRVSLGFKQISPDPWSNIEEKYPIDGHLRGKVVSITNYGIFVELEEGVEGLIHISEMSWNKYLKHPSRLVAIGDMVDAQVLSFDKEKKKISLSIKQMESNPWDSIEDRYPIGTVVEGRVRNLTDFGAFVELEDGIDGLVHRSDMSWTQKVKHPSEVVKKRDWIKTIVLNIDKENEKISLGMKQLMDDPWDKMADEYQVGMEVEGEIIKVTKFGAFVKLPKGVEALVHASQMSQEAEDPKSIVNVGDVVKAKVLKIDIPNRKMALSIESIVSRGPGKVAEDDSEVEDDDGDYDDLSDESEETTKEESAE